ncbi:MAG: contractile injection system protein, VgrG/Pvc8 family, partial [Bryobacteraceae bacterium]
MGNDYVAAGRYLYLKTPLDDDDLLITSFSGREGLSQLFQFTIQCQAKNTTTIAFEKLLGQKISFGVNGADDSGEPRHFDGIAIQVVQEGRGAELTSYSITVVPKFWLLTRTLQ